MDFSMRDHSFVTPKMKHENKWAFCHWLKVHHNPPASSIWLGFDGNIGLNPHRLGRLLFLQEQHL